MKLKDFLVPFLVFIVTLMACQNEYSEELYDDLPESGQFIGIVDGTAWSADQEITTTRENGVIILEGISLDGKEVEINLIDVGEGTYTLNSTTENYANVNILSGTGANSYSTNASSDPLLAGGQVVITNIDENTKTISGTFAFNLVSPSDGDTIKVTQGVFTNLSWDTTGTGGPIDTTGPNPGVGDTFQVKKDGVAWSNQELDVEGGTTIYIDSYNAAGASIDLEFPEDIAVGSYQFNQSQYLGNYWVTDDGPIFVADGGELKILEHDMTAGRIRGSFNFVGTNIDSATDKTTLTEGYFNVSYK